MEAARTAVVGDLDAIALLTRQGIAELRPNRGGAVWHRYEAAAEPHEPRLGALLSGEDPTGLAVVGTIDDVVVGYGLVGTDTLHDGATIAVVSDLYVDPEARGIGLGEAMMDQLVAWAEDRGAIGIDALALPGDRHTKNFFETFGLTARAIVVHRDLGPREHAPSPSPSPAS